MNDKENPTVASSAAWRAFWTKIRELNARETERRRNGADAHEQIEPVVTDHGTGGLRSVMGSAAADAK